MPINASFLRKLIRYLVLVAAILLQETVSSCAAPRVAGKVLLLNSYSVEDLWTTGTNRGISAAFEESGANIEFFVENLDITGTFSAMHLPELRELYRARYTSLPPDLIITTGNDATTFALGQIGVLFPDVPIVFCSLTNEALLSIFPRTKGTGVFSENAPLFLLREINRLHRDAPSIALITDMSPRGFRDIAQLNEAATALSIPKKRLRPLFGMDIEELASSLSELPPGSVIILGHYSITRDGELVSFSRLIESIQEATELPVYSLLEEGAALGVLGSVSEGGFEKGFAAGEMAFAILQGAPPESIPPRKGMDPKLLFNYSGMREFNISRSALPAGSVILGDPFYGIQEYVPFIFANVLLLLFLGGLAVYLKRKINRRKKTEGALLQQTEYWKKLFEHSPQGILIYDGEGRIREANNRFREMFRFSMQAPLPENIMSLLSGTEADFLRNDIFPPEKVPSETAAPPKEAALPDGDGGTLSVSFQAFPLSSNDEDKNFCALFHDIGDRKSMESKLHRRTLLQERMTAISSRFVLFQNFRDSMEAALEDMLSLSGARTASLFVMSDSGILVPEMEAFSPEKGGPSLAANFTDGDDFFWKSLLLNEALPAVTTIESTVHRVRDSKWDFLRRIGIESITILPLFVKTSFQGFLALADPLPQWVDTANEPLLGLFSDLMAMAIERRKEDESLRETHERIHDRFTGAITALCQVSELRDVSTSGHQKNVSVLAERLANEMQLPEEVRMAVRYAGLVHDLGKLYIPAEILGKPSSLSEAEYELVKKHPEFGHDILSLLNFPWPLAEIVLQHHERVDGTGYPYCLKRKDIRLEARILSVVDAFEAMTSDRPYRKKKTVHASLKELMDLAGQAYDAKIVKTFVKMILDYGETSSDTNY